MNKRQELEVLADAIAKLGPDSYLGPWLLNISAEVKRAIWSDFLPELSLAQAKADCDNMRREAKSVLDKAHQSAKDIIEAGHRTVRANNEIAKLDVNKAIEGAIKALRECQYQV